MPAASFSGSLNYQAPGGALINQDFVAVGSYGASSLGTLDVPSGSSSGATFTIPLGGVANPIAYFLKSSVGTSAIIKTQGNPTGQAITDGGFFAHGNTKTPAGNASPLSAITVQLTAAQTAYGSIDYLIFGD